VATDDDRGAGGGPTPPPDDEGGADHPSVVQTPEEVARAFIESGARMVPVKAQPDPITPGRRRRMVAGIAAAVIVLGVLGAVTLLHTNQPAPASSTHTTRTSAVTPVKRTVPSTTGTTSTTTTAPAALPPASTITVTVLNASTADGLAAQISLALGQAGFTVAPPGTAPTKIPAGSPSQILYGPGGLAAAHVLAASLSGPVTMVLSPLAQGTNLTLDVASAQLTVVPASVTTTTAPPANP
jgi:hypothetical protein